MNKTFTNVLSSLLVAHVAACGGSSAGSDGTGAVTRSITGPLMRPGEDCIRCHSSFSAAGTVFSGGAGASDVTVVVGGVTLSSNGAGNFFTQSPMSFPATAAVSRGGVTLTMPTPAPNGACNTCHGAGATAPISAP